MPVLGIKNSTEEETEAQISESTQQEIKRTEFKLTASFNPSFTFYTLLTQQLDTVTMLRGHISPQMQIYFT